MGKAEGGFCWGFSTLGCPELGMEEVVALAAGNGFSAIELRFLNGTDDLNAALGHFLSDPGSMDRLHGSGVTVSALLTSFPLCRSDAAGFSGLRESALLADRLAAPYVRVFDGLEWGEELTEEDVNRCRRFLDEWDMWRAASGVRCEIAVETHGATAASTKMLELFSKAGRRLPVIWDTHHTYRMAGETFPATWTALGDCVVEVHVKDSVLKPSDGLPYTYVLPGAGSFPVPEVLALLHRHGYGGKVILEWERRWHPSLPPIGEAIAALLQTGWMH